MALKGDTANTIAQKDYVSSSTFSKLYLGNKQVKEVYLGSNRIINAYLGNKPLIGVTAENCPIEISMYDANLYSQDYPGYVVIENTYVHNNSALELVVYVLHNPKSQNIGFNITYNSSKKISITPTNSAINVNIGGANNGKNTLTFSPKGSRTYVGSTINFTDKTTYPSSASEKSTNPVAYTYCRHSDFVIKYTHNSNYVAYIRPWFVSFHNVNVPEGSSSRPWSPKGKIYSLLKHINYVDGVSISNFYIVNSDGSKQTINFTAYSGTLNVSNLPAKSNWLVANMGTNLGSVGKKISKIEFTLTLSNQTINLPSSSHNNWYIVIVIGVSIGNNTPQSIYDCYYLCYAEYGFSRGNSRNISINADIIQLINDIHDMLSSRYITGDTDISFVITLSIHST